MLNLPSIIRLWFEMDCWQLPDMVLSEGEVTVENSFIWLEELISHGIPSAILHRNISREYFRSLRDGAVWYIGTYLIPVHGKYAGYDVIAIHKMSRTYEDDPVMAYGKAQS